MEALYRYPFQKRAEIASKWGKISYTVQSKKRSLREIDDENTHYRDLWDRKGRVLRQGICWKNGKQLNWHVCYSILGKTNQFDLVSNGKVILTGGIRKLPIEFRP